MLWKKKRVLFRVLQHSKAVCKHGGAESGPRFGVAAHECLTADLSCEAARYTCTAAEKFLDAQSWGDERDG